MAAASGVVFLNNVISVSITVSNVHIHAAALGPETSQYMTSNRSSFPVKSVCVKTARVYNTANL